MSDEFFDAINRGLDALNVSDIEREMQKKKLLNELGNIAEQWRKEDVQSHQKVVDLKNHNHFKNKERF